MKCSTERILTTHVGSLTRPAEIIDAMRARVNQEPYDRESFAASLRKGVAEVVRRQAEVGIDIVSDGEFGKSGFAAYINERLGGFERRPGNPGESGVSRRSRACNARRLTHTPSARRSASRRGNICSGSQVRHAQAVRYPCTACNSRRDTNSAVVWAKAAWGPSTKRWTDTSADRWQSR